MMRESFSKWVLPEQIGRRFRIIEITQTSELSILAHDVIEVKNILDHITVALFFGI